MNSSHTVKLGQRRSRGHRTAFMNMNTTHYLLLNSEYYLTTTAKVSKLNTQDTATYYKNCRDLNTTYSIVISFLSTWSFKQRTNCKRTQLGTKQTLAELSTGWPPKSKPLPMIKKLYLVLLKPVSEIRFIRQIKEWIKHYNIIRWYCIFYEWLTFCLNNCMTRKLAICVTYG